MARLGVLFMLNVRWKAWSMAWVVCGGLSGMLSAQTYADTVQDLQKAHQKEWSEAADGGSPATEPASDARSEAENRRQSMVLGSMLGLPSVGDGQATNVLGVVQYCLDDGLGDEPMQVIHQQLLDRVNGGDVSALQNDSGYRQGARGILSGQDEQTFDLNTLDQKHLRKPACDYIANEASFLLWGTSLA